MKKRLLVFLSLTPMLLASCNKNSSLNFNNPFPDDSYIKRKIGFNFADDEVGKLSISSDEIALVNKTVSESSEYDKYIHHCKIESHERDYTRAFAGVFKQGYQCSNSMIDSYSDIYFKEEDASNKNRKWSIDETNKTVDYEYGKSSSTFNTASFNYYGQVDEDNKVKESVKDDAVRIASQTGDYKESSKYSFLSSSIIAKKEDDVWKGKGGTTYNEDNAFYIRQNENNLMFNTSECTVPALAALNDKGVRKIILIKETKEKHGQDGMFKLNDGKKFLSMDNSLTVTQLIKQTQEQKDFYLITSSRRYTETTITSEQIELNAQITMLNNPITIKYSETIYKFELTPSEGYKEVTTTLPEIIDEEPSI